MLREGKTVSGFNEAAGSRHAEVRAAQREFVKRGLEAEAVAEWVTPEQVFAAVRKAAVRAKRRAKA